jgi:transcription initiation factor TFIIA large subunit
VALANPVRPIEHVRAQTSMSVVDDEGEDDMNDMDDDDEPLLDDEQPTGNVEDNEPLNSEDDEDSDEGGDTLFETSDIVICQFEKVRPCTEFVQMSVMQVTRTRNRWKFVLKDGLIEVNNVDRVFHRATGEAEW